MDPRERLAWINAEREQFRQRTVKSAQHQIGMYVLNYSVDQLTAAVAAQEKEVTKLLRFIGASLAAEAIPKPLIAKTHQDVANMVGRSIVAAYTHRRHRRSIESYRTEDPARYAGGKMLRALQNENNYVGDAQGIHILQRGLLDAEAAQWYRLNFGAGGLGGSTNQPQMFPITWGGLYLFSLGISGPTSPSFLLPPGVFVGADGKRVARDPAAVGQNPFYFAGGHPPPGGFGRGGFGKFRPTRGIEANNFIDAGARRLATELPKAYLSMYDHLVESKHLGGIAATVRVPPPQRRRAQRVNGRLI